jgi:transcriptional regulator of nitric oxide reductase
MAIAKKVKDCEGHRLADIPVKCKPSLKKPSSYDMRARRTISVDAALSLFLLAERNANESIKSYITDPSEKKVRFAPMATVFSVPTATQSDTSTKWYGTSDYKVFESDRKNTIVAVQWALQNCINLDSDCFTIVGLENILFPQDILERRRRLIQHRCRVLREQYLARCKLVQFPLSSGHRRLSLASMYPYAIEEYQHMAADLESISQLSSVPE